MGIVAKAIKVNNLTPRPDGPEDEGGFVIDDVLTDERIRSPDDVLGEADDLERIFTRIGELDVREATVIRMRFGLEPYAPMTLREIGENLHLTRERVRQLETLALARLVDSLVDQESEGKLGN